MRLVFVLLLLLLITALFLGSKPEQSGGGEDPYAWLRPMTIIDFLRSFPLTR